MKEMIVFKTTVGAAENALDIDPTLSSGINW